MEFLIDQLIIYVSLAVITAILIDIFVIEGRNIVLMIFMAIFGAFTGWVSYMIFTFITGGLEQWTIWYSLPIILTSLVSIVVLLKFADIKVMFRKPRWKLGPYTTFGAMAILFVLLGSFVILAFIPVNISGVSVSETQTLNISGRNPINDQKIS